MVTSLLDGVAGGGVAFKVLNERSEANGQTLDPATIPTFFETYSTWYADFQRAMFHSPERAALVVKSPAGEGRYGEQRPKHDGDDHVGAVDLLLVLYGCVRDDVHFAGIRGRDTGTPIHHTDKPHNNI
jgi:hypothetical protein